MLLIAFPFGLSAAAFTAAVSSVVASVIAYGRFKRRHVIMDPVDALTQRVRKQGRHPVRYAVTHPVETVRRVFRG